MERKIIAIGVLSVLLGASVGACGAFALREVSMQREAMAHQQRILRSSCRSCSSYRVHGRASNCLEKRRCWLSMWKAVSRIWTRANRRRAAR